MYERKAHVERKDACSFTYENKVHFDGEPAFFNVSGSTTDLLPALLLIHGDSYSWGAGNSFDGTSLAAHGRLIVVSINFRIGVLGEYSSRISFRLFFSFLFFFSFEATTIGRVAR